MHNLMKRGRTLWIAVAVCIGLGIAASALAIWRAHRALTRSEQQVSASGSLRFQIRRLNPLPNPGFTSISAPAVFAGAAYFGGSFYLSGPAGLFAWSPEGALEHVWRPGQDFPATALGAMTVGTPADARQPELLIATTSQGVLAFDGQSFRQILPTEEDARDVAALLALPSGRLLLGTAHHGLLVYDGRSLRALHPTTSSVSVTSLAGSESDLWIGTVAHGLLHWRGGQTETLGVAQGLPDPRVDAVIVSGVRVFAGTPVGVAEIRQGKVVRVLAKGRFAHAIQVAGNSLLVGQPEAGVLRVPLAAEGPAMAIRRPITEQNSDAAYQPNGISIEQFLSVAGRTYALAANGLLAQSADGEWQPVLSRAAGMLTARHISALLTASDGRLWVGYFDRGLDILPAAGGAARHIENSHIFCVNRIVEDPRQGLIAVGTANGLVLFDRDGRQRQVLGRHAGLIADDVMDLALYGSGMALATPAGITFLDPGGSSSVYAFQGLVNNHVYALGVQGHELLAGTLGGLSLLDGETVRRSFTTANSGLERNWITGLVRARDGWLIGTYGAGVLRLNADGKVTATGATRDGVIVNSTAMLADGNVVLAGTLRHGLLVGDATGTRWRTITAGLPSLDVTALAASGGVVYVGTESGLVKIEESQLE
jgi:ligand-binding sensor domain-containing protein